MSAADARGGTTWSTRTKVGWGLVLLGTALVTATAGRYATLDPDVYFPRQRQVYEQRSSWLLLHIGGMCLATLTGPWQFLRPLRQRHPRLHRVLGRVYLVGVVVGGTGGLLLAPYSAYGLATHVPFALLGTGVLLTTAMAYVQVRRRDLQRHREWMTRSFALIFAAVTLRLYAPVLEAALGEHHGYVAAAWSCWPPNLLVAEWLVRARLRQSPEGQRAAVPRQRGPASRRAAQAVDGVGTGQPRVVLDAPAQDAQQ